MNDKMVFGQYYSGNSVIHRIDARTKIITLIVMMVAAFLIPYNNFIPLAVCAGFILLIIILSRVPFLKYLKSLKQIAFLMVFSFAFQLFANTSGEVLLALPLQFTVMNLVIVVAMFVIFILLRKFLKFKMLILLGLICLSFYLCQFPIVGSTLWRWNVQFHKGGLISGSFIIARVFIIIMLSTTLTLTTKPMDLANGLEWLLKPFEWIGIKTSILAMMISIALRFIPTLFNETDKILKAQASRGADFKEGKLHEQIKQVISLLVPMFVISFKRAVDLADAMEARGYIPGSKRTKLLKLKFRFKDLGAFILVAGLLAFVIVWRINYAI